MRRFLRLLQLEWKRALRALPLMFAEAVLMCAFLGAAFLLCQKLFYGDEVFHKIPIGIVATDENPMTELALQYLEGMESTSASCDFRRLSFDEGQKELEGGKLAALMVLPEEMLESILDSRNYPVKVYFPPNSSVEALFLRELMDAGADMLSMAQAEVYAVYDLSMSFQKMESLAQMQEDINLFNMKFAAARERLIREHTLQISEEMPLMLYYAAAGITLFLMLWGIACAKFLKGDTGAFGGQLTRSGTHRWEWMLCKLAGTLFILCLGAAGLLTLLTPLCGALRSMGIAISVQWDSAWLLGVTVLCIAAMVLFCYQAAPSRSSGMMLVFIITIVMIFVSGGLVPSVFLPQTVQRIAGWLPCRSMLLLTGSLLGAELTGDMQSRAVVQLIFWSVLFYLAALLVNKRKGEREL